MMNWQDIRTHYTGEVQKEFRRIFAYLKIEFRAARNLPSRMPELLHPEGDDWPRHIRESAQKLLYHQVGISRDMKVKELEDKLQEHLGGSVQVYRKSGNLWMETSLTGHWTLGDQNDHAEDIALGFS